MYAHGDRHRCVVKRKATALRAQKKYEQTENGKAALRRYRQTPKGQAVMQHSARKRIFIGHAYHSRASTVEQAAAINAHVRRRVDERKAAASACSSAVQSESTNGNSPDHRSRRC